jgi:hypothetical protein
MKQWIRGWRGVVALALLAGAVLVPLYGDPRATPVTHAEWARMLVRSLELESFLTPTTQASVVFSLLSWKDSLSFSPEQAFASQAVAIVRRDNRSALVASEGSGEVDFRLAIVRTGEYRIRARLSGDPGVESAAEITPVGGEIALRTFTIKPPLESTWIDVGSAHLDRGAYDATVAVPPGLALERLEVAPPCVNPIEPQGGWRTLALSSPSDLAVTAIKALNREDDLAPAETAAELKGTDMQIMGGAQVTTVAAGAESTWLRAGRGGLQAMLTIEPATDGLYAVSAYGTEGAGQRWLADGCQERVVCPPDKPSEAEWHPILTAHFTAGRHLLAVKLGSGATVQRIRIERKRETGDDYVAALRRAGFDVGTTDPVTRRTAIDLMSFILEQRRLGPRAEDRVCGDILRSDRDAGDATGRTVVDGYGPPPDLPPGIGGPPPGTGGQLPPPVEPPIIPPGQDPASPTSP